MSEHTFLKFEDHIKEIESGAYSENNILEEIHFNQVQTIGYSAFQECRFLKDVTFTSQTQLIGSHAFQKCLRLKSIAIPDSAHLVIEPCAFLYCPLESVDFGTRTDFSNIHDNTLLIAGERCPICKSKIQKTRNGIFCPSCQADYGWDDLEAFAKMHIAPSGILKEYTAYNGFLTIPKGISCIAPQAFDDSAISSVTIPDTVAQIGTRAFHWCDHLAELSLHTTKLKRIEHQTFTGTLIPYFHSPPNLEYIGRSSFSTCHLLDSVFMEDSVKMIGEMAFYDCPQIKNLGISSSATIIGASAFENNFSLEILTIPSSVLTLQNDCFRNCYNLAFVRFQEGLLHIGKSAFFGCDRLTELSLPDSLLSIEEGAFKNCTRLKTVSLSSSLRDLNFSSIFEPSVMIHFR